MTKKRAREIFKEMITLCYEEDYPELHKELLSLEYVTKKSKEPYKYEGAIKDLIDTIPIFADDFPLETLSKIEELYQEYFESSI